MAARQTGRAAHPVWRRLGAQPIVGTILLLGVGFFVLYPIALLVIFSLQVGDFGQDTHWGLDNWASVLREPRMRDAISNTLGLTLARQIIAFAIGLPIAWLVARTNLPGRNWLEFGFWISFLMPAMSVTVSWLLLADGRRGLLNQALMQLPFVKQPVFEIFSWWGIVFAHLMAGAIAAKVMLLTPAFRNMDSSLEEAAFASGASLWRTLHQIVLPLMAPAILVVLVLSTIRSLEAFEIEFVLGRPRGIDVYSTLIYRRVLQEPPEYGAASVMAVVVLLILLPMVIAQHWASGRRDYTTVSGKHSRRLYDLGRWRWPLFWLLALLVGVLTVLPVTMLFVGSFMSLFGFFVRDPWTLSHWQATLSHPNFLNATRNSLLIGGGVALLAMLLFSLIAYVTIRTRFVARGALSILTWLPSMIPGVVVGLGFLWFFLSSPLFRPLYGTIYIMIIAVAVGSMTLGVQVIRSTMAQLGAELEEASSTSGATWLYTFGRVVLPLVAPAVAVAGLYSFVTAVRSTSLIALLQTGNTRPLSMLQLDFLADGSFERACVAGLVLLLLSVGVAIVARVVGLRLAETG